MTSRADPAWVGSITPQQWKALAAAMLGWLLDAMDVMMYAFALTAIRAEFGLSAAAAGGLASVTLLTSAVGGIGFGMLADRIGRARALVYSILIYSVFTALTATARSLPELILWRSLVGIGLGGEWAAGSVLVASVAGGAPGQAISSCSRGASATSWRVRPRDHAVPRVEALRGWRHSAAGGGSVECRRAEIWRRGMGNAGHLA
jgi:predicted MFS family arabinose efflux permease